MVGESNINLLMKNDLLLCKFVDKNGIPNKKYEIKFNFYILDISC